MSDVRSAKGRIRPGERQIHIAAAFVNQPSRKATTAKEIVNYGSGEKTGDAVFALLSPTPPSTLCAVIFAFRTCYTASAWSNKPRQGEAIL